jgi:nucleotide-binding universal stress UspA family protein
MMIQLTNILVPVDFSSASERAVNFGLSLALQFHARLVLAHIVPSVAALNYTFPAETYEHEKQAFADARQRLPKVLPAGYRDRFEVRSIVKTGDVRTELLGIMDEEKIDLVVMGTHGRRNIERFLLGSTTETMLRKVAVPILTVSRPAAGEDVRKPGPVPVRRIVYATDYSDSAGIGLHYAAELARTFGADLTVLHVMDRLELWGSELIEHPPDHITRVRDIAVEKLLQVVKPEQTADLKLQTVAVEGTPHREIPRFAEDAVADLIVLNVQSKSVLERAMLGATAERVIRSARVPVLSIPTSTAGRFTRRGGRPISSNG